MQSLPWAIGKHQLTKAYMLFLAHWARKLSWQETAVALLPARKHGRRTLILHDDLRRYMESLPSTTVGKREGSHD